MKAELFSSDFMISMFVFLAAFLVITVYYENLQSDVYENSNRNDMMSRAIKVASLLAESSGYPQYWNSTNVQIIGLYDSGKFNLTKFEYLKNDTDYQTAKTMLGIGVYNFFISLKNTTGDIIEKPGTNYNYFYGMPIVNSEQTVLIKRMGVVNLEGNSTKVTMEVVLWI
jgi:hypothetical protein